jgi:hypothetical protein
MRKRLRATHTFTLTITCVLALWSAACTTLPQPADTTLSRAHGTWTRPGTGEIVRISPKEVVLYTFTRDNPHIAIGNVVHDDAQSATVRVEGLLETWQTTLAGPQALDLSRGCRVQRYVRAADSPTELAIRTVTVPAERPPIDPSDAAEIAAELAHRMQLDQSARRGGSDTARREVDRDNTAYLEELLGRYGWIDAARFGDRASCTAAIFVNHSGDLGLKMAVRKEVERDIQNSPATSECYMVVLDSLRIQSGERQLYGSQICRTRAQEAVVCALEDPQRVDQLRVATGAPPLKSYLQDYSRLLYGGKQIADPLRDPEAGICP